MISEENVELVRAAYEALNTRDAAAILASVDPDVEFVSVGTAMEGGLAFHGRQGILDYLAMLPQVWSSWAWTVRLARSMTTGCLPSSISGRLASAAMSR